VGEGHIATGPWIVDNGCYGYSLTTGCPALIGWGQMNMGPTCKAGPRWLGPHPKATAKDDAWFWEPRAALLRTSGCAEGRTL